MFQAIIIINFKNMINIEWLQKVKKPNKEKIRKF